MMIVLLDLTVEHLSSMDAESLSSRLEELLRSYRLGHHVVIMRRNVARWLAEHTSISPQALASLRKISQEFTQTGDLAQRAPVALRVRSGAPVNPLKNGRFFDISLEGITLPYLLERVVLVVEDVTNDMQFYDLLFRSVRSMVGVPTMSVEPAHGGGSRTIDVAVAKAKERRIVCAIFDTDRSAPRVEKHAKIERIEREAEGLAWPLLTATAADCREVENLIPYSIASSLPCAAANHDMPLVEKILDDELSNAVHPSQSFWLYFDIKEGYDSEKTESISDEQDRKWLIGKVKSVQPTGENVSFRGFGPNVIQQIVQTHTVHGDLRKMLRSPKWWDVFGDYISYLIWLGAALPKEYA